VLQVATFTSLEEAYNSINQFIKDYNMDWILHRLNYCFPVEYREKYAESRRKEKMIYAGLIFCIHECCIFVA
jgi:putative transposase